ncbi:hypothetical protein [Burkholderia stagnalis]
MKKLIYERDARGGAESIGIRLYKVRGGYIAERYLVESDSLALVQVLPLESRQDFDAFAEADPHYTLMRAIYDDVRRIVWPNDVEGNQ